MTFPFKLSDMRNKALQILPTIERAVEIYATEPEVTHQQVADRIGINFKTLLRIRRDPNFWAKVYDHYMVAFEGDVVNVLKAAVREATAGNVQAQRLVLEHSGKLQKNIVIKHESPFERFLKSAPIEADYEVIEGDRPQTPTFTEQPLKVFKTGREKKLQKRRESYRLRKRAELVGMKPLGIGRHSRSEFKEWMNELNRKEALNE